MKFLKLLPIIGVTCMALLLNHSQAQQAADSTAQADLSQYDTADKLWTFIHEHPENKPADFTGYIRGKVAAAREFVKRYPRDSRAAQARVFVAGADETLVQLGDKSVNIDQDEQDLKALIADPATSSEAKQSGRLTLLSIHYRSSMPNPTAEVADEIAAFVKDFPSNSAVPQLQRMRLQILQKTSPAQADALLAELLKDPNPAVARMAQGEEAKMEVTKKPLDLKFTAVDGSEVDISKLRGKVVLVDFWATWCGPCMGEVPNVVATYNQYHDKGFEIVGISLDQDKAKLLSVTKEKGMVWPQYFDGQGWNNKVSSGFGINSIPAMWLVNKNGMVVSTNAREDLPGLVAKLLAE